MTLQGSATRAMATERLQALHRDRLIPRLPTAAAVRSLATLFFHASPTPFRRACQVDSAPVTFDDSRQGRMTVCQGTLKGPTFTRFCPSLALAVRWPHLGAGGR